MNTQDVVAIAAGLSILTPLVVQLLAHAKASAQTKALIALAVSTGVGVVVQYLALPHWSWAAVGTAVLAAEVTTVGAHLGGWKPLGVTGSTGLIAAKLPAGVK